MRKGIFYRGLDLCKCVCSIGSKDNVTEGTAERDKHGIENVSRERHPGLIHKVEQVGIVLTGGIYHEETRREYEQFIKRLQRLADSVNHRKYHDYSNNTKHEEYTEVAFFGTCYRTLKLGFVAQTLIIVVTQFCFDILERHITYLPF